MSAIPSRPPKTTRLARALGLDGQPSAPGHRPGRGLDPRRNASRIPDRRMAGGHRRRALDVPRRDDRGPGAGCGQTTAPGRFCWSRLGPCHHGRVQRDDQARALAPWEGTGAAPRTGKVLATLGSPTGSVVTVWLDASGKLTGPPLQPAQITDRTIAVAALVPAVLALSLLTALWLAHRLADRRRLAAWDAAWSTVGPQWTRRRP